MEYIEIKEQIKQKLPVARDLGDSENLLELGLSSLTIMRLVNQWRKQGVKVSFGSLMENPSTVDSLMSWNYQSVEKILNQLTKMHFRTAKLSETLLLAIKAR